MVLRGFGFVTLFLLHAVFCVDSGSSGSINESTTEIPTTTTNPSPKTTTQQITTTTESIDQICARVGNGSCDTCVSNAKCYYCYKTQKCAHYPYAVHKFYFEGCGSMTDMAWGTCLINFQALIISMGVLAGVLLLSLMICCCCCCKKRKANMWARNQAKWERQREERKARSEERKKERQSKTDEIRRKYGLVKDDNPYQRFDA